MFLLQFIRKLILKPKNDLLEKNNSYVFWSGYEFVIINLGVVWLLTIGKGNILNIDDESIIVILM